jgi:RNA polymerase sigma-70 factor (ECF subfamily)
MNGQDEPSEPDQYVDLSELTDKSLLRRFKDGQQDAATALYLRYAKRLQALANSKSGTDVVLRVDPEGIVQSVFRTFFRRAAKGQYDVLDENDLWKLFLVIALNKIRATAASHRTAKRDVKRTVSWGIKPESEAGTNVGDEVALSILRLTIDEAIAHVPEESQPVIRMRVDGYRVDQIASKTKRSKRSVERILQQFRNHLHKVIHD